MANGRLGAVTLTQNTNATVYTVPADTFSVITINVCNKLGTTAKVRVALASADTPVAGEYIEHDTDLLPYGVLERAGVVLDAGKKVVVYSNSTDTDVVVYGIETATA